MLDRHAYDGISLITYHFSFPVVIRRPGYPCGHVDLSKAKGLVRVIQQCANGSGGPQGKPALRRLFAFEPVRPIGVEAGGPVTSYP
jgi:hypothetical protein